MISNRHKRPVNRQICGNGSFEAYARKFRKFLVGLGNEMPFTAQ
jgi:hypothetical protein